MSTKLIRLIKRTALDVIENSKPVNALIGTVENITPIEIRLNQRLLIGYENIVSTQILSELSIDDRVALLRVQGGQKYIVMDVIV